MTENILTHFVAFLYREGLKAGTVKSYLAATHYTQIALGLGNPHMENMNKLEYVIRGVKRLTSAPTCTRLPITLPLLAKLRGAWYAGQLKRDAMLLWAAAPMCFFSFLRVGEVVLPSDLAFNPSVHLSVADISVDSHLGATYIAVNIKVSKTHPFRRGVMIYLGRTHGQN